VGSGKVDFTRGVGVCLCLRACVVTYAPVIHGLLNWCVVACFEVVTVIGVAVSDVVSRVQDDFAIKKKAEGRQFSH
jgi:hypothetical protein